jgi:hypothetical protein
MKRKLQFREDQTFTIVQFTDLHCNDAGFEPEGGLSSNELNSRTRRLMQDVIHAEQPDLIVLTGDVIMAGYCEDPIRSFREAVEVIEASGIPWAYVYGNHDTEVKVTREEMMSAILEHEHTVTEAGPADLPGCGNYVLDVTDRDGKTTAALYFLDSGGMSAVPGVAGYDWIRREQIHWYVEESRRLTERNGGTPLPALAFFHIPLPEYNTVWEQGNARGNKFEKVCCPSMNSGFFAAMVEMGDIMGTFVGHDHINDFEGELYGIRLCYGRSTGYDSYGKEGMERGARVIRLQAHQREFETWIRLADRTVLRYFK